MGEESERRRVGPRQGSVRDRTCRAGTTPQDNAVLRMERVSRKKWQPGSRRNSREIRGDRGLGRQQGVPGHVHVRPARSGPPRLLPVARRRAVRARAHRRRAHQDDPRDPPRPARPPRRAPDLGRTRHARCPGRRQTGLAPDEGRRPARTPPAGLEENDRRRPATHRRPRPDRTRLHRRQPNTHWCGDITYVRTVEGWGYTATVIDLHSRKVVGYAVADHLRTTLVIDALAAPIVT